MNYWLVKSEPETYSWQQLEKDGETRWDGVRNFQARNNLMEMKKGDLLLFYHSINQKQVVGIARVKKEFYPDPTTNDNRWVAVDIEPVSPLKSKVTLQKIKLDHRLENIALLKQSRLSVMPLAKEEFAAIVELGNTLMT